MSGIKRVRISVSRIYAALRLNYASKAGGRIPRGFAQLVDEAVADRIMTVASRTLISDCLMAMAADEDEVEQEGALDAALQLQQLARRIEGRVPVGSLPGLPRPVVLDSWTPLATALSELAAHDGFAAVRDDDGYCVLLSLADAGAWLASQEAGAADVEHLEAGALLGNAREEWVAFDQRVALEQVEEALSDTSQRVAAALVFDNEDYAGDPVGIVTARTMADWRRDAERRRREADELLQGELASLAGGLPDRTGGSSSRIEPRAHDRGAQRPVAQGGGDLSRAIAVAVAGSARGLTCRELAQMLRGRGGSGLVSRGLADLPVFGCAPQLTSRELALMLADLTAAKVLRRLGDGSYVLTARTLMALSARDPYQAFDQLFDDVSEEVADDAR
ncbi:MAG: hypothetical protein SOV74_00575 [Coriobacteriales bacterium]|nr:hypothetical protein [Coriobacteriales bacterium]